jgi:hypothetical protein
MAAVTVSTRRESVVGDLRLAFVTFSGASLSTFTPGWDVVFVADPVSTPTLITNVAIGSPSVTTPPAITFTSSAPMVGETVMVWGR